MTYRKYTGSLSKRYGPFFRLLATHLPGERGALSRMLVTVHPAPPRPPLDVSSPFSRRNSVYVAVSAVVMSCAVLALLLAGIAAGNMGAQVAGQPLADAQQVLRYGLPDSGQISTLDPAIATDPNALQAIQLLFPGLVTFDDELRPVPWAAASIDVSADGRVYTFHLRPHLAWSDGAPIDAATFAYAINRTLHPCTRSLVAYYLYALKDAVLFNTERCAADGSAQAAPGQRAPQVNSLIGDSIIARDPRTLTLTLAQPVAYFLAALAYPTSFAVPRQLIDRFDADWIWHLTDGGGLGGSLFVLTTWESSGRVVLARNERYWGAKPRLRQVEFMPTHDAGAAYADYLAGKTQIGFAPPERYAAAKTHAGFGEASLLQIDYYAMSWRRAPFDDVRMRQAFALALDKTALAQNALHGAATPTNHLVPAGMPGYNASLTAPDGSDTLTGDPDRARELAQSYANDKCGGQLAKCPAVALTIPAGNPAVAAQAQAALGMWRQALPGYPISLAALDQGALLTALSSHALQLWYITWIADYPDAQDWLTNQFLPSAAYNDGDVNLPEATRQMLAADVTRDPTTRLQRYAAAEQLLVASVAWLPLDQPKLWWEAAPGVVGFRLDGRGMSTLAMWQQLYLAHR